MLPVAIEERIRTSEFWSEFFFVDEDRASAWRPWQLAFPLARSRLSLVLSADATGYLSLSLGAGDRWYEVAWDDLAHWHPHVLRWDELDDICRASERAAPAYPHPGVTLLMLARFAPIVSDLDAEQALPQLQAAWQRLDVGISPARARLLEIVDLRGSGVEWRRVPDLGWCLQQTVERSPRLYSLRTATNSEFPWQQWNEFTSELAVANE